MMRKISLALFCLISISSFAQQKPTDLDKSPMDMSYSPPNYPILKMDGKTLSKGRYTMYAICTDSVWTIIFNSDKDVWGLYYNPKKDVLRVNEPVQKSNESVEALTMYFEDMSGGTTLNILWDTTRVALPINF